MTEKLPADPRPLGVPLAQRLRVGRRRLRPWPLVAGALLLLSAAIVIAGWVFFVLGIARLGD